jgi:hypothetical protein
MPGPELGFVEDLGESPVHSAAVGRSALAVHAPAQQWMGEMQSVPVDSDDALLLGLLERGDDLVGVASDRPRDDLHRGIGQTRGGQERCAGCDGQAADPGADEFGEAAR